MSIEALKQKTYIYWNFKYLFTLYPFDWVKVFAILIDCIWTHILYYRNNFVCPQTGIITAQMLRNQIENVITKYVNKYLSLIGQYQINFKS